VWPPPRPKRHRHRLTAAALPSPRIPRVLDSTEGCVRVGPTTRGRDAARVEAAEEVRRCDARVGRRRRGI
jgi:hypothetical protein